MKREIMVAKPRSFVTLFLLGIAVLAGEGQAANISSCQTIGTPGNYTLTQNLKVTAITTNSPNCLVINHSNVAIDLNGFNITGMGNGTGAGITDNGNGYSQIIVANGKIQGFDTGISVSNYITIAGMRVVQNTATGISIGSYGSVTDTHADQNGQDGITVVALVTVSNSQANYNGGNGMVLGDDNNTVNNSQANHNGGNGMLFGHNNEVVNNSQANNNGGNGMFFTYDFVSVSNSEANNNSGNGIYLNSGSWATVSKSEANNNGQIGIDLVGAPNFVTSNEAQGNDRGFSISCTSNIFGNDAQHNTNGNVTGVTNCVFLDNKGLP